MSVCNSATVAFIRATRASTSSMTVASPAFDWAALPSSFFKAGSMPLAGATFSSLATPVAAVVGVTSQSVAARAASLPRLSFIPKNA